MADLWLCKLRLANAMQVGGIPVTATGEQHQCTANDMRGWSRTARKMNASTSASERHITENVGSEDECKWASRSEKS